MRKSYINWLFKSTKKPDQSLAQINRAQAIELAERLGKEIREIKERITTILERIILFIIFTFLTNVLISNIDVSFN